MGQELKQFIISCLLRDGGEESENPYRAKASVP